MPHSELYIDGVWYPSATTITSAQPKPWLQAWRDKWGHLADRKMKIAGSVGTEFHRCVDEYLDTGTFAVSQSFTSSSSCGPRVEGMMRSFVDWAQKTDGVIHSTEMKVISRQYVYSGTLDAVGTLDGKPVIYDWKTSSRIYSDMDLQLVAYAQAYKEETGVTIKEGLIVHVSKDKPHFKVTTKMFKLGKRVLNEFLKLREMFDDINEAPKGDTIE